MVVVYERDQLKYSLGVFILSPSISSSFNTLFVDDDPSNSAGRPIKGITVHLEKSEAWLCAYPTIGLPLDSCVGSANENVSTPARIVLPLVWHSLLATGLFPLLVFSFPRSHPTKLKKPDKMCRGHWSRSTLSPETQNSSRTR
ncbi:hypothetical protein BDP27DRAFT_234448 [Rhodocollybia butyracea]|uniref:Uncharacterized protein n=1 Tax=Rhodocollybia butyracea TaxID=206335 RepID=A0A9P5PE37_9AGAR|nr:hypothetical protein BDP27DRAFT_234448 [Rhodocollybia butyracea]